MTTISDVSIPNHLANVLQADLDKARPNTPFENLYYHEHAKGSALTFVLRTFDAFFDNQCVTDNTCYMVAMRISHVVLAIFVYPIFGLLALIGVVVNAYHLSMHNEAMKKWASDQFRMQPSEEVKYEGALYPLTNKNVVVQEMQKSEGGGFSSVVMTHGTDDDSSLSDHLGILSRFEPPRGDDTPLSTRYNKLKDFIPQAIDKATEQGIFIRKVQITPSDKEPDLLTDCMMYGHPGTRVVRHGAGSRLELSVESEAPTPQDAVRIFRRFLTENYTTLNSHFSGL